MLPNCKGVRKALARTGQPCMPGSIRHTFEQCDNGMRRSMATFCRGTLAMDVPGSPIKPLTQRSNRVPEEDVHERQHVLHLLREDLQKVVRCTTLRSLCARRMFRQVDHDADRTRSGRDLPRLPPHVFLSFAARRGTLVNKPSIRPANLKNERRWWTD